MKPCMAFPEKTFPYKSSKIASKDSSKFETVIPAPWNEHSLLMAGATHQVVVQLVTHTNTIKHWANSLPWCLPRQPAWTCAPDIEPDPLICLGMEIHYTCSSHSSHCTISTSTAFYKSTLLLAAQGPPLPAAGAISSEARGQRRLAREGDREGPRHLGSRDLRGEVTIRLGSGT